MTSKDDVEARIDALASQARLEEAAQLAIARGLPGKASSLLEQACDFARAAEQALAAEDATRAVRLSALAGDSALVERAVQACARDPHRARAAAGLVRAHGHSFIAARLLERIGEDREAASAYAQAGRAVQAAAAYERAGDPREAARVLETANRADPNDEEVTVHLGSLLVRHQRFEPAARLLQQIAEGSSRRNAALPLLISCYEALGLTDPLAALQAEATRRGLQAARNENAFAPSEQGTEIIYGRYELVRTVASSPSARVYLAIDQMTGAKVAVKQLRAEGAVGAGRDALERMVREARALEQLRHPGVVPLVELVAHGAAVVTPWMGGGSLGELMLRDRLSPARAVDIACHVLGALAEAHRIGIVHRDVKPSNVLFDDAGATRLADFGAAHVSDISATATAGVIGTLAYMSPEQRYGQPATPLSDVYGVGATLLEMLTGQPPQPTAAAPHRPSGFHPDLRPEHDDAVLAMLAHPPGTRPQGALAARARLQVLAWPNTIRGKRLEAQPAEDINPGAAERLARGPAGVAQDRWLGRRVRVVPDEPSVRQAARAYASLGSPALATVLRVDSDAGEIWFEEPEGERLADTGALLSEPQMRVLKEALVALHAKGVTHGAVDAAHVWIRDGMPVLAFARSTGAEEVDLNGLRRLGGLPRGT